MLESANAEPALSPRSFLHPDLISSVFGLMCLEPVVSALDFVELNLPLLLRSFM